MTEFFSNVSLSHRLLADGTIALLLALPAAPVCGIAYEWVRERLTPRQTLRLRFLSGSPAQDISIIDVRTGKLLGLTDARGFATVRWVETVELWGGNELFESHNARPHHWLRVATLDRSARDRELIVRPSAPRDEGPPSPNEKGSASSSGEGEEHER